MANVLKNELRVRIIAALAEGTGVRATARQIEVDKNTVLALGLRVGDGCWHLHNRLVRGVRALIIEGDETWSFIYKKESRVDPTKDPAEWGDAYTYIGLDATAKLVIAYLVGKRDAPSADAFAKDLRSRLVMVPHLSTDGFNAYPAVIAAHFGGSVDYGQAVKNYRTGSSRGPDHRYEPPRDPFVTKTTVLGAPIMSLIGTPHVERYNLTQRHIVGRTRRLCLAFSKTKHGHEAAIALGVAVYNFVREHSALGTTPAVAAGIADHPWTIAELVEAALAEVACEKPVPVPLILPAERAGHVVGGARELPNGRGFLRVVGEDAPPARGAPQVPPPAGPGPGPAAPAVALVAVEASADTSGQLDLLSWRPRPEVPAPPREPSKRLTPRQLGLFGIDLEPEPKE